MAISVNTTYPARVYAPDANYDQGSIKNETVPDTSDDGTPLDEKWGNDFEGCKQSLMKSAGITPTAPGNVPETMLVSQITQSIVELASGRAYNYDDSGAADVYVFDVQTNQQAPQSLFVGFEARGIITVTNTGASTINVAGLGVKNIKTQTGANPAAGELTSGDDVLFRYDGTNFEIVPLNMATDAEMLAGLSDSKIVTPKRLRLGFSALAASNGYIAFPTWMGGIIIQWGGRILTTTGGTVTFPIAFTTATFYGMASDKGPTVLGGASVWDSTAGTLSTARFVFAVIPQDMVYIVIGH